MKANPTTFEMQKDSMQQGKDFEKMLVLKEEMFAKKKQYYGYKARAHLLEEKIKQYEKIIDSFDSYLSRGDKDTLEGRIKYLEE